MRKTITKGLAVLPVIAVMVFTAGCAGESRHEWAVDIIEPDVTSETLIIPEGILPYTLDTGEDSEISTQVTFNYPEVWQLSNSREDLGVESKSEMLTSFVSANGEGVIVERFTQELKEAREVSLDTNSTDTQLPVLPNSQLSDITSLEGVKIVSHKIPGTEDIEQVSRVIEGADGYSYSITLLQRHPSEITDEQAKYIMDSFSLSG